MHKQAKISREKQRITKIAEDLQRFAGSGTAHVLSSAGQMTKTVLTHIARAADT